MVRLGLALCLFACLVPTADGQGGVGGAYVRGVELEAAGDWTGAARAYGEAVAREPAYAGPAGSAAYLLGSALGRLNDAEGAATAFVRGRRALAEVGLVDLRLDEALVLAGPLVGVDSVTVEASAAYRTLLTEADRTRLGAHLRAMALLMPVEEAERLGLGDSDGPLDRPALLGWWAQRDPVLTTERNERLDEHLARVAVAYVRFGTGTDTDGALFDDRGNVFVRFGAPEREDTIRLEGGEFERNAASQISSFRPSEVPQNELWAYPSLDRAAVFLFVRQPDGTFRLGSPDDLVPRSMRSGLGGSERGQKKAQALLFALGAIYQQMVRYDARYYPYAHDVADYTTVLDFEARDRALQAAGARRATGAAFQTADAGTTERGAEVRRRSLNQPVSVFADIALAELTATAMESKGERERMLPLAQSAIYQTARVLPAALRTTRFLSPAGATQFEVDWAVPTEALSEVGADSVYLSFAAVPSDGRGWPLERHRSDFLVGGRGGGEFPVQAYTLPLPDGAKGVTVQWNVHPVLGRGGGRLTPGPVAATNSARLEAVERLAAEGFEVSDLRPIESVGGTPYPFLQAAPGLPLSLYFEIYGLDEEQGQFTVEYAVTRRRRGTVLQRSREDTTDGRLASQAAGGRSAQYLILETAGWERADEVEVEVTVTSRTGDRRVRSVRFEIVE